jgi:hypothetical protein
MINLELALRTFFKSPFVLLVAIISLAPGIGTSAAIFSLFDRMLLRALRVPDHQLKGGELVVFAGAPVWLALVAPGAGFIPAHRASRIDPMRALRYE